MSSGYAHARYAASLAEWGTPRHLPGAGGWLLERAIPGSDRRDAMGPYPLLCCEDWTRLGPDLDALADDLVSVVAVSDPFCPLPAERLAGPFDAAVPFKDHYVVDLSAPLEETVSKSHRATVRRARKQVRVALVDEPTGRLDEWVDLWRHLTDRHSLTGLRAFSAEAFALQLAVPGLVMFEATCDGEVVGLDLWYVDGDVAYGHLVAFDDRGYQTRASYASKWAVLEYFAADPVVRWVDLGGVAGTSDADNGLARFKAGWSNDVRTAHLCTRVLQPAAYEDLCRAGGESERQYFPAYRAGELASGS